MPVLNLMVQHGRTLEDARRGLETAVYRVSGEFGSLVRRTEWTPDHQRVKLEGVGGSGSSYGSMRRRSTRWVTSRSSQVCSAVTWPRA
jgi:hypothetical protein